MREKGRYSERTLFMYGVSLFILLIFSSTSNPQMCTIDIVPEKVKVYSQSLIPHAPISISNDAEFKTLGFEGDGTKTSPYIIENLSIYTDVWTCISIKSTTVHFVIQNCELSGSNDKSGTGVYFEKVVNGAVIDCNIHSLYIGISVLKSEQCEVNTNKFSGLGKGIYLTQSRWMTIEGNDIAKSGYGIHLSKLDYCDLMSNIIIDCQYGTLIENCVEIGTWSNQITESFFGLYFHNSLRGVSFGNIISKSRYGIYFAYSRDCNISSSILKGNNYGVSLLEVDGGIISSNLIKLNSEYGIHLKNCRNIEILSNTIFDNLGVGLYLYGVSGTSIHNNEIGFNSGVNAADFVGSAAKDLVNNWDTNAWSDYIGSINYSISGDRGSLDNDPRYILFMNSPPDQTVEAPASGFINWSASAFKPNHYAITVNGDTVEEGSWGGKAISKSFTTLDPGTYTYVLSLTTESGITASDDVVLTVHDTTAPEWVLIPEDQVIECGSSLSYQILATDYYGISSWWVNRSDFSINDGLLQNIDALHYGVYHLEVRAYDPYDNYAAQSFNILVIDSISPTVDSPDDIEFFEGETGHQIVWSVSDCNPLSYEILMNGSSIESGYWSSDMTYIQYSLDDLSSGIYIFSIVLTDIAGNIISDEVQVIVEDFVNTNTPSSPTTSPGTESPTPTGGDMTGPNTLTLGFIGVGVGAAIIVIIVFIRRK
ncbi:MAG: NosD domain-containing protein [Promethearchaeota archaeon]